MGLVELLSQITCFSHRHASIFITTCTLTDIHRIQYVPISLTVILHKFFLHNAFSLKQMLL